MRRAVLGGPLRAVWQVCRWARKRLMRGSSLEKMEKSRLIGVRDLLMPTLLSGAGSLLLLAVAVPFRHYDIVLGVCGGVGQFAALIAAVVGLWSAIRLHSLRLLIAALPALAAVAGWVWFDLRFLWLPTH